MDNFKFTIFNLVIINNLLYSGFKLCLIRIFHTYGVIYIQFNCDMGAGYIECVSMTCFICLNKWVFLFSSGSVPNSFYPVWTSSCLYANNMKNPILRFLASQQKTTRVSFLLSPWQGLLRVFTRTLYFNILSFFPIILYKSVRGTHRVVIFVNHIPRFRVYGWPRMLDLKQLHFRGISKPGAVHSCREARG